MTVVRAFRFDEVFREEVQAINARRRELGRQDLIALEIEDPSTESTSQPNSEAGTPETASATRGDKNVLPEREPIMRPTAGSNVIGVALSGGGIRSASFCLGALQALDKAAVLQNVDYLSTVSGGGYIGT